MAVILLYGYRREKTPIEEEEEDEGEENDDEEEDHWLVSRVCTRLLINMATFFGEVLSVYSRAVEEDDYDDEEQENEEDAQIRREIEEKRCVHCSQLAAQLAK